MTYSLENAKSLNNNREASIDIIDYRKLNRIAKVVANLYCLLSKAKEDGLGSTVIESLDTALTKAMQESQSICTTKGSFVAAEYIQQSIEKEIALIEGRENTDSGNLLNAEQG